MKTCNIVMSCYNEKPEWLLKCINSLRHQVPTDGYKHNLIIGVDHCEETARLFEKEKIPYFWPAENVGLYVMINSMIAKNPADIYVLFDSDDIAQPFYLKAIIPVVEKYGIARASFTPCNSDLLPIEPHRRLCGRIGVRHDVYNALGGFHRYRAYGDTDFVKRAVKLLKIDLAEMEADPNFIIKTYYRRLHESSNTAPGKYGVGGKYYKDVKKKLTLLLQNGKIKIIPTTTDLELREP